MLLLLDALRGLAALFVVLHHACSLLWRGEALDAAIQAGAVPGWALALLNPLDFVRVPVMLFFILSGFCIHYRQATSLAAWDRVSPVPVPSWSAFAWRRLIRLYPVLLFALALTLALDAVGRTANPALYANGLGWSPKVRQGLHISEPTLDVLLANLLMQAEIVRPHLGSNGPLWSLG
ncbi:MAG TPA: acyltransferase family protein, partial [Chloroflexota bacterium]|nr:acyltransferase family protein [Chloroflexota bacterium]